MTCLVPKNYSVPLKQHLKHIIVMTTTVTTASNAERSFSLLKLVQTRLCSTMSESHLNSLYERGQSSKINPHDVNVFASCKSCP